MKNSPKHVEECPLCGGSGWKTLPLKADAVSGEKKKVPQVMRCDCRTDLRAERLMTKARIPPRYEHCSLASFHSDFEGADSSLKSALFHAERFVQEHPLDQSGLLFTGPVGVGKTHLAVGIIRELILQKGIQCFFCNYRDLLKQIQNSYNPDVKATELEILRPVFECEVVVLDELGAIRPTEWAFETVSLIINTRYNDKRTTIITTNFPDGEEAPATLDQTKRAARCETLGDRVGAPMRSRLSEMCRIIRVNGSDFRLGAMDATRRY